MNSSQKNRFAEYISFVGGPSQRDKPSHYSAIGSLSSELCIKFANFVQLENILTCKGDRSFATHNYGIGGLEDGDSEDVNTSLGANTKEREAEETYKNPVKVVSLEHFLHSDKNSIVAVLKNIPSGLINAGYLLEELLDYVMNNLITEYHVVTRSSTESIHLNTNFKWAFLPNNYMSNTEVVFILFSDILALHLFQETFKIFKDKDGSNRKLEIITSEYLQKPLELLENSIEIENFQSIGQKLGCSLSKKYGEIMNKVDELPVEKDDKYSLTSSATGYTIDKAALANVPDMLLETVKTSIVDFKLSASRIEELRVKKRRAQEEKKTKSKLQHLFNNLKSEELDAEDRMQVNNDESDEKRKFEEDRDHTYDDNGDDGGFPEDEMGDLDCEKRMIQRKEHRIDLEFQRRLVIHKRSEKQRLNMLDKFDSTIKSDKYLECVIPEARERFMKSFVSNVNNTANTVDKNFSYYTNHGNYIKYRRALRLLEEKKDRGDLEEEMLEKSAANDAGAFMSSFSQKPFKRLKISIKNGLKNNL